MGIHFFRKFNGSKPSQPRVYKVSKDARVCERLAAECRGPGNQSRRQGKKLTAVDLEHIPKARLKVRGIPPFEQMV